MSDCIVTCEYKIGEPRLGPQSRALCGAVCALSIAIVLY